MAFSTEGLLRGSMIKNFDPKKYMKNSSTASLSAQTTMPEAKDYSIAAPADADNQGLVQELGGGIRSRNDAAADQAILSTSRATGGDTSSPLFQFLATNAKTGAAGTTGATIADLRFKAAEAGAQRELQRQIANQQAAMSAQNMANQFSMGQQAFGLNLLQFQEGQRQFDQSAAFKQNEVDRVNALTAPLTRTTPGVNRLAFDVSRGLPM